jgi:hypothetical protein
MYLFLVKGQSIYFYEFIFELLLKYELREIYMTQNRVVYQLSFEQTTHTKLYRNVSK